MRSPTTMPAALLALLAASAIAGPAVAAPKVETIPTTHYEVIASGAATGDHPTRGSAVRVRYTGTLTDGSVFIKSEGQPDGSVIFPVRSVIPGFQSSLMLMRRGDRWRITIPPEQGYGSTGSKLSGKTLTFDLELIDFAEMPPGPSPMLGELPKPKP